MVPTLSLIIMRHYGPLTTYCVDSHRVQGSYIQIKKKQKKTTTSLKKLITIIKLIKVIKITKKKLSFLCNLTVIQIIYILYTEVANIIHSLNQRYQDEINSRIHLR